MKQLAIPLGYQKTTTKWLVIMNCPYTTVNNKKTAPHHV